MTKPVLIRKILRYMSTVYPYVTCNITLLLIQLHILTICIVIRYITLAAVTMFSGVIYKTVRIVPFLRKPYSRISNLHKTKQISTYMYI